MPDPACRRVLGQAVEQDHLVGSGEVPQGVHIRILEPDDEARLLAAAPERLLTMILGWNSYRASALGTVGAPLD